MKKIRILSIDGGGMRGIIPATILVYLEKQLKELTNNPNARIADFFDLIVGTSTGGILSAFYLTPTSNKDPLRPSTQYSAQEALSFYLENGYQIFNQSKRKNWLGLRHLVNAAKYSPLAIENKLKSTFGDLKMSQLVKPCLITTYNMVSKAAFFFNSREDNGKKRDFYLKDVLRSTSAAPTYFPPARIKNLKSEDRMYNIDGGVFANNPSLCAYAEARNSEFEKFSNTPPTIEEMLFLSLGTGGGRFELPSMSRSHRWGLINWGKVVPEIMMDGSIDTVNYQMLELFGALRKPLKNQYLRIDVLPKKRKGYSNDMADASPQNIKNLQNAGKETLSKFKPQLDSFIKTLIINS